MNPFGHLSWSTMLVDRSGGLAGGRAAGLRPGVGLARTQAVARAVSSLWQSSVAGVLRATCLRSGGMDLNGKVAMVTGGSGDIGGAICVALAEAGCDIALTYVGNTAGAEETAAAVTAAGRPGAPGRTSTSATRRRSTPPWPTWSARSVAATSW